MTRWSPHCDPSRVARWQAIDREREARRASQPPAAPEPPAPPRPKPERYERHRYGRAVEGRDGGGYRVLRGPTSAG